MTALTLIVEGEAVRCSIERRTDGYAVHVAGLTHHMHVVELAPGAVRLICGGRGHVARVARDGRRRFLTIDGCTFEYTRAPDSATPRVVHRADHGALTAPMPGAVVQVLVGVGEEVTRGQPLVIVEAMKMEHVVRAPTAGRIDAVPARPGDQVEAGVVLVELTARPDEPAR